MATLRTTTSDHATHSIPPQPPPPLLLFLPHNPPNPPPQNLNLAFILPPRRLRAPHPNKPRKHSHLHLQPLHLAQPAVLGQSTVGGEQRPAPVHGLRVRVLEPVVERGGQWLRLAVESG